MEKNFDLGIFILEAYNLYKSKNYKSTINFIETLIDKYKRIDDSYLQYILILSYLHTGNFYKVDQLLKVQKRYHTESKIVDEIDAYIILKGAPTIDQPLIKYIELSEKFHDDKKIKYVLSLIRSAEDFKKLQKSILLEQCISLTKPGYRRKILNRKKSIRINFKYYIYRTTVIILSSFILFVIIFILVSTFVKRSKIQYNTSPQQNELTEIIDLNDLRYSIIDKDLKSNFENTYEIENDLKKDFVKSQYLIKDSKYNDGLIILNKILNSNANYKVKEKAQFLIEFIDDIELNNRDFTNIDLKNFISSPEIYRGVVFKSNGIVNNISNKETKTVFTLDVIQNDKIYIIEVFFNNKENIDDKDKVILKAKFLNKISNDQIYVEGVQIKKY